MYTFVVLYYGAGWHTQVEGEPCARFPWGISAAKYSSCFEGTWRMPFEGHKDVISSQGSTVLSNDAVITCSGRAI